MAVLFDEVIALRPDELDEVRKKALAGDKPALKLYAYYGAWMMIKDDRFIPFSKKEAVFKALCVADLVEVELGR